ncbi:sodium-coupled monocarboxylate transporter 2-like [Homalodisca vitripennis]|uniref:sodium-coupled monocarboxylate transporter 2-like n=1 Tax=Homalodisca vitripennis TaxID=197043 RepID=UPI001EEAEEC1|nr:sodium-coupled monocarboxylate transporter 2-like [Homalodisca vitripennis]
MGLVSMCCYTGLVIFAYFHTCDPISTKMIKKSDQLLPYFVMEIAGSVPGFPGVFMSGVFSAALSSMSTGLNSMCGVIFTDFVRPCLKEPVSELRSSWIMKGIVLIFGVICVAMVFFVEKLGAIIQAGKSLAGITTGTLLGMFSLGMFFPWANSEGALAGSVVSLALLAWLSVGTQTAVARGQITFPQKPIFTYGCPEEVLNRTLTFVHAAPNAGEPFAVFRLSYMWYSLVGTATTLLVGMAVSWWTGFTDPATVDRDLLTPVIHRFLPPTSTPATSTQNNADLELKKRHNS